MQQVTYFSNISTALLPLNALNSIPGQPPSSGPFGNRNIFHYLFLPPPPPPPPPKLAYDVCQKHYSRETSNFNSNTRAVLRRLSLLGVRRRRGIGGGFCYLTRRYWMGMRRRRRPRRRRPHRPPTGRWRGGRGGSPQGKCNIYF